MYIFFVLFFFVSFEMTNWMFTIAIGTSDEYSNDLSISIVNVGREMFGIGQYKMTRQMNNGIKIVF